MRLKTAVYALNSGTGSRGDMVLGFQETHSDLQSLEWYDLSLSRENFH